MDHERWLLKGAVVLVVLTYTGARVAVGSDGSVGQVGVGAGTYAAAAWDRDVEEAADGCDGAVLVVSSSESEESESRTLNADIRCIRLKNGCKSPNEAINTFTARLTRVKH